jgi:hypothetical protein
MLKHCGEKYKGNNRADPIPNIALLKAFYSDDESTNEK